MSTPLGGAAATQAITDTQATESRYSGRFGHLRHRWEQFPRWQQWFVLALFAVLLYALPILNPPFITTEPGNDWQLACFDMARFALIALGLNVVVGQAGLLDLGYVGFFAVGSYVAALWTSPDSTYIHIPYLWTLPLAMVVTVFFGVVLGIPTLRLRGDYLAIVTLGFGEIIRLLATLIPALKGQVGFQNVGAPPGTDAAGREIFNNSAGTPWYWFTVTIIIIVIMLLTNLERSRVGRAWIAIREDEDAAEIMGVPTFRFKIWAFGIGAAIGGLSGAVFAGQVGFVNNQKFDVQTSILFLAAVVLGGSGNKYGAVLGGALVSYIPLRFTAVADYKYLIFGAALVVMMIFRPQGLLGTRSQLLANARTIGATARRLIGAAPAVEVDADATAAPLSVEEAVTEEVADIVAPDRTVETAVGENLAEIKDLSVTFGGLTALDHVSFDIRRGEILGLIGPNGAGKTTCFNAMTGVYAPSSGDVTLDGTSVIGRAQHSITRLGIARTFQNIRLFGEMTALENVVVGLDARHRTGTWGALFRAPRHRREERESIERGLALLGFVGIADRAEVLARNLPYGYQRRLEIARALATEPKLLCLDEPAAGFNPAEKDELMELIRTIRDDGYTILLIEHDMRLVMGVTDRIVVLEFGKKIAEGAPAEIRNDPAVIAAYLGEEADDGSA
ncbi:MAG TPA: branched-chain amino acid ABC transporter ATP-binding protein/permease [Aeromicrobium sp.]|nr:branched-chain amino acid ABC transporter ATP-binding protein/permease [Aeromicrobium sp.]